MFLGKFNVLYVARWFFKCGSCLPVYWVCHHANGVLEPQDQKHSHFLFTHKLANEHEMFKIKGQEIGSNKVQILLTSVFIFPDNFWLLLPTFWHKSVLSTPYIFKPGLLLKFECIWGHCFSIFSHCRPPPQHHKTDFNGAYHLGQM